jgi:hypothetical protein
MTRYLPTMCLIAALVGTIAARSSTAASDKTSMFDMPGRQIIHDEEHLGIANGRATCGISYRDVGGVSGLWAPPFVSSNFTLDFRVSGAKAMTDDWTWRPYQVLRSGAVGDVKVTSKTTLLYGHRVSVLSVSLHNTGKQAAPLDVFTLAWLDSVKDWGFGRAGSGTPTALRVDKRCLVMQQGELGIHVGIDSPDWSWEASGNLGHAHAMLPAGEKRVVHVAAAIGSTKDARAELDKVLDDPAAALQAADAEYGRRIEEIVTKLPSLESSNRQLVNWYNRSLVHFMMSRWDVPEFKLNPYYSTGSVKGGCVCNYLWNFGEVWEILPLFDAPAARTHIKQFLDIDLLKHFFFYPIDGRGDGLWYMVNQEKVIGLTYFYVMLTGDVGFLAETVDGKTIADHMVIHAMYGDDVNKPIGLIDYSASNSHLELRRGLPYNHIMPDLNGRRYANYLRVATLCELAGKPMPHLRERAEMLKPVFKQRLWDPKARWFRFEDDKGKGDLRYTVQMFKMVGSGVLDKECESGLLSHLNDKEFLSQWGLHSLSKRDPAYDQLDIDNGGGGNCTCFPPQVIERLYQANRPDLAADLISRLLWWGETMPYWGDSIAANCKDYRRDTPLQCTFDGVTVAQSVIFGVFGVSVRADGDIIIKPHAIPFASDMALSGLKLRGQSVDVRVAGKQFEIRSGDQKLTGAIGKTAALSTKDGKLRIMD